MPASKLNEKNIVLFRGGPRPPLRPLNYYSSPGGTGGATVGFGAGARVAVGLGAEGSISTVLVGAGVGRGGFLPFSGVAAGVAFGSGITGLV